MCVKQINKHDKDFIPYPCEGSVGIIGKNKHVLHVLLIPEGVCADTSVADHQQDPEEESVEQDLPDDCPHLYLFKPLFPGQPQRPGVRRLRLV